jgi:hypothetical protein
MKPKATRKTPATIAIRLPMKSLVTFDLVMTFSFAASYDSMEPSAPAAR